MLGVDTNVLVRFLVRDDEAQFEKARKLIKREVAAGRRVFVNQLVLMETEWVLRSRYLWPRIRSSQPSRAYWMRPMSNSKMSQPLKKLFSSGRILLPISLIV